MNINVHGVLKAPIFNPYTVERNAANVVVFPGYCCNFGI